MKKWGAVVLRKRQWEEGGSWRVPAEKRGKRGGATTQRNATGERQPEPCTCLLVWYNMVGVSNGLRGTNATPTPVRGAVPHERAVADMVAMAAREVCRPLHGVSNPYLTGWRQLQPLCSEASCASCHPSSVSRRHHSTAKESGSFHSYNVPLPARQVGSRAVNLSTSILLG